MSETLKMLKPPRRTASLLLQHMVDKLLELTSVRLAVNYLLVDEDMNAILTSHRIDSESLRTDDFEVSMAKRARALLDLVEKAMGKTIKTPPESTPPFDGQPESDDGEE